MYFKKFFRRYFRPIRVRQLKYIVVKKIFTIYLNNKNSDDFYYVLKLLSELECEVNFIDENFFDYDYTLFKNLIDVKQKTINQVVINCTLYVNK